MSFFNENEQIVFKSSSSVGKWKIETEDGLVVNFYGDSAMDALLGISETVTPEERRDFFITHVFSDDVNVVGNFINCLSNAETEVEFRYIHPTTGFRLYRWSGIKSHSDAGKESMVGWLHDVTEIVHLQYQQEKDDRTLALLTQRLYSYNITIDADSKDYTLITGTGMTRTVEILKNNTNFDDVMLIVRKLIVPEYLPPLEELLDFRRLKAVQNDGFVGNIEFPVTYENDAGREWHELNVFVEIEDGVTRTINILGRDVSAYHEQQERIAYEMKANEAKSSFLFNMSHDIRTPMNAIMGFTNLLERNIEDKELVRGYIKKIQKSNTVLLSLINNVLEMTRIEKGKVVLEENLLEIGELGETISTIFSESMKEKGIEFVQHIDVAHSMVLCDSTKIREIFLNLLSNAQKYTSAGGRIDLSLSEVGSNRDGYALYKLVVEDNGIGMSKEFVGHIFDEFSRERTSTESRVEGTGLGMAIVKKLLDLMGGSIEVDSEIGRGTKISVFLSLKIAPSENVAETFVEEESVDKSLFAGKRILLAEDNALNAEIAIAVLTDVGFEVDHAEDGVVCVDKLEKSKDGYYDLILMDVQMPNLNGYGATQSIRAMPNVAKAKIPIIALTANAFAEDKKAAFNAGMNGHLAKPIDVNAMMKELTLTLR